MQEGKSFPFNLRVVSLASPKKEQQNQKTTQQQPSTIHSSERDEKNIPRVEMQYSV